MRLLTHFAKIGMIYLLSNRGKIVIFHISNFGLVLGDGAVGG